MGGYGRCFGKNQYLTTSIPLEFVRDARDDKLNPTEGFRASVAAKPSYEALNGTFFSSFEGSIRLQGPRAEDRLIMAGKLAGGVLVGGSDLQDIPTTRRFMLAAAAPSRLQLPGNITLQCRWRRNRRPLVCRGLR